jgi:hypothetical protein
MNAFSPRLDILPEPQGRLWPQLPAALQDRLRQEASELRELPPCERKSDRISPSD